MSKKQTWAMCMVGKFAYEGIKAFFFKFFQPGKVYPKEYIKEVFDNFYDETGMRLEYYGDDYDMVTFMRNKIYLISRNESGQYYLNSNGERFRSLLLADEERFRVELFKWVYSYSRTRFRSLFVFVERLKEWLKERGPMIPTKEFPLLVDNVLGKHRFNEGVISLLESLGLFKKVLEGYKLNRDLFNVILSKDEELRTIHSILKSLSSDNKILYRDAVAAINKEFSITEDESMNWLKELEKKDLLIIRSTRGGKYIEL